MTNYTLLSDPQEWIGKRWSEDPSPDRVRLLSLARDVLNFLDATGQRHRFEDFHQHPGFSARPRTPDNLDERFIQTESLLSKLRDETGSEEERAQIQVILDALQFISSTDQHGAFNEYRRHVEAGGPPLVVASFDTREEAEAWLKKHPQPPDFANILIANQYHFVTHDRSTNIRRLPRSRDLEYYLAGLKREEPPIAIASSFANLGEAEAWLQSQAKSAVRAWISIAGELYLAAYYANIDHRALYPLSMAEGYEAEPDESPQ
ncbi:hypothetical protein [Stigmatella aurantiaca]|uniref:Uncharacterized protein n=1 Tax=Stigmatella aurantiaca (strain DW4/3-1) TaxID=378806 RepID=Q096I9_STIAD|nr:hypothetical protein [Stigmatella aurantiaca]ADO68725.1 uncharacterized protein STAUR_0921 [Stigmatella aurantiaca DW4/3-1]EAU67634.1 hypothetical protein STIAU_0619 [Stigmatella aurantiaca DW4/3-1]